MLKKYLFMFVLLPFVYGCQTVSVQKLPMPSEDLTVVSADRVRLEFAKYPTIKFPDLLDTKYVIMDDDYCIELIETIAFNKKLLRLMYRSEAFDCDNFASLFKEAVKIAFRLSKGEPLVFECLHEVKYPWGGVEAGGYHDINLIYTTNGLRVVEPNSNIGETCLMKDYPNKDFIYQLK